VRLLALTPHQPQLLTLMGNGRETRTARVSLVAKRAETTSGRMFLLCGTGHHRFGEFFDLVDGRVARASNQGDSLWRLFSIPWRTGKQRRLRLFFRPAGLLCRGNRFFYCRPSNPRWLMISAIMGEFTPAPALSSLIGTCRVGFMNVPSAWVLVHYRRCSKP